MRAAIIHAHCYQPPREDPWLEQVPVEPSASPDHDWNARIDRECYARLAAAEVRVATPRVEDSITGATAGAQGGDGQAMVLPPLDRARDIGPPPAPDAPGGLARLVNLYAWCPFDVGATLCEWLEPHAPATYAAMLAGDRASQQRLGGHGNAIAAPYHHIILPLASRRDKETEVRWGMADFRRRFGRDPVGMWLPETAVDEETLEVLAAAGIRFTVLAPSQVRRHSADGRPLRYRASGGREVALFVYDGALAGEVAFGSLLRDPAALESRLVPHPTTSTDRSAHVTAITTLATDGETFGHHHRGGEVTLARAVARLAARPDASVVNFEWALAHMPPNEDAELVAPSAWSCAHGVERWRSDCGCRLDAGANTSQAWRGPLRRALEWLAGEAHSAFVREGTALFANDPWAVRDAYGTVVAQDGEALSQFVRGQLRPERADDAGALVRARELLELQRAVLRTFTSCAWFFDDVARIEARQVLRYAARAVALSGHAARLEPALVERLAAAHSNDPRAGTAGDLFVRTAVPHRPPEVRVAAAVAALVVADLADSVLGDPARLGSYDVQLPDRPASGDGAPDRDSTRSTPLLIRLVHRRTGAVSEHHAVPLADEPGGVPRISLRTTERGQLGIPTILDVREFPDDAAYPLLQRHVLNPFPDAPFAPFTPR